MITIFFANPFCVLINVPVVIYRISPQVRNGISSVKSDKALIQQSLQDVLIGTAECSDFLLYVFH